LKPRRRSLLIFVLGLLVGLAVVRVFCWQGIFVPHLIASGSMVPTLRGAHFAVVCQDCSFFFRCDATSSPESGKAVCPNCGFPDNALTEQQFRLRGQRVVIDRFPYLLRMPRRWELVAFHDPQVPESKAVKRVVGLPGETVVIRQGDLFVNGRILRRPIDVQRSMTVLVHDDAFRPARTNNLPPRWDAEQEQSGWESNSTSYHFLPTAEVGQIDWLTYRNWRCFVSPFARSEETPVRDHYGYNQNASRGKLHDVTDLMLSCRVRWSRPSRLWLSLRNGRDTFEVELDRGHSTATIRRDDVVIDNRHCPLTDVCQLEFGICDRQVFLTVNRHVTIRIDFEPSDRQRRPVTRPLAVGGQGGELMIGELKVYRDVYYLEPHGWGQNWTMRTQSGGREILVLGDNVPISRDSRRWKSPGLSHKSLIGRVFTPF
jgi:signal peptidase I